MKCIICEKEAIMTAKVDGIDYPICEKHAGEPIVTPLPYVDVIDMIKEL